MSDSEFVDLGKFGKFSVSTLVKNRRLKWKWEDGPKFKIPEFLEDNLDKEKRGLRKRKRIIENKKHRRIEDIRDCLEGLDEIDKELCQIVKYENKIEKIVNRGG